MNDYPVEWESGAVSKIEQIYRESIVAMTPQQRLARCVSMYAQIHEMLRCKILKETPDLSHRELRRRVAQRMYLTDPKTQDLLRRIV